jgi:hypothetical protein
LVVPRTFPPLFLPDVMAGKSGLELREHGHRTWPRMVTDQAEGYGGGLEFWCASMNVENGPTVSPFPEYVSSCQCSSGNSSRVRSPSSGRKKTSEFFDKLATVDVEGLHDDKRP